MEKVLRVFCVPIALTKGLRGRVYAGSQGLGVHDVWQMVLWCEEDMWFAVNDSARSLYWTQLFTTLMTPFRSIQTPVKRSQLWIQLRSLALVSCYSRTACVMSDEFVPSLLHRCREGWSV